MSIIFKKQKPIKRIKRKNPFFRKDAFKGKKEHKRMVQHKKSMFFRRILTVFIIILAVILVIFLSYLIINTLTNLKSGNRNVVDIGMVEGFEDIPTYPNSQFVFSNKLKDESVRKFLSQGKSIYRLPNKTSIVDVYQYYRDKLGEYNWEHVQSVPFESEEQRYGEYWIKDNKGLRISGKYNDIWYERVTTTDANTGMKDDVKKDSELKLLLLTKEFENLRPDYPWRLQVPSEYLISYSPSDMGELLSVSFKKINSSDTIVIYPIGYTGSQPFDIQLDKYLLSANKEKKSKWKVVSSFITTVNGLDGLKASLINSGSTGEAYVVTNTRNNVNYVIMSDNSTNPLLKYISEKIESARRTYEEEIN